MGASGLASLLPIHVKLGARGIRLDGLEKDSENKDNMNCAPSLPFWILMGCFPFWTKDWPIIRKICDTYRVLLIIDEVICGSGRTGKWFGVQHFDIQRDLITMAKGISSGYVPLGGVGCTDTVIEPVEIFQHLHTYGNHPVSCAAALKNIEIMERENLIENSCNMGLYFLEKLRSLEPHPIVGEVRETGLWTAIDLTLDKEKRTLFPVIRLGNFVKRAKAKGLIIKTMGHALEFGPPLIIQKREIDEAVRILDEQITEEENEMNLKS